MRTDRTRRTRTALAVLLIIAGAALTVAAGDQVAVAADEAAIRAARVQSNQAIGSHDVPGIARHWTSDVHIVTSTSAQGSGRDVNGQRMAQQFSRRTDTVYVRTPSAVEVFPAWAVASERGQWIGRWTEPDGVVEIAGTYLAQWRKLDGVWLIQAEVFVPTSCRGSRYCEARP